MIAFKWYVTIISTAALLAGCFSTEKKRNHDKNAAAIGLTQDKNSSNIDRKTTNTQVRGEHHKQIARHNGNENVGTSLNQNYGKHSAEESLTRESEDAQGSAAVTLPFLAKSLKSASFDFLLPLNKDDNNLVFSQIGARRYDGRNIINFGVGQRHFFDGWMLGYNSFYDRQISGNQHQRLSVGLELWKDYLKFSSNSYHRLSGWKSSGHLNQSDERVANGYDLRLEAVVPSYPQLAGKLTYEQYIGSQVATTTPHERYDNPSALTLGMSYTPVPLVSMGFDHSRWNSGKTDNKLNLSFNYQINVPLSKQLDSKMMPQFRTLSAQRLDLVDRNHKIVLEHKDKKISDEIKLALPAEFMGFEGERKQVYLTVTSKYEIDHVHWNACDFLSRGGKIIKNSALDYHIQLPQYDSHGINQFFIIATAYDKNGNASNRSQMTIHTERYNPAQFEKNTASSQAAHKTIAEMEQTDNPIDIPAEREGDDRNLQSDDYHSYYPSSDEELSDTDNFYSSSYKDNQDNLYNPAHGTVMDEVGRVNTISNSEVDDDNPSSDETTIDNDYDFDDMTSEDKNNDTKPLLSSLFSEEDKNKLIGTLNEMSKEKQNNVADELNKRLNGHLNTNVDTVSEHGFGETFTENQNVDLVTAPPPPPLPPLVTTQQQEKLKVIHNETPPNKRPLLNLDFGEEILKKRKDMGLDKNDGGSDENREEKSDIDSNLKARLPSQNAGQHPNPLRNLINVIPEIKRPPVDSEFEIRGAMVSDDSSDDKWNDD